jgi:hypothetical protein
MAAAFKVETVFVRSCAKTYASEIGFDPPAEDGMASLGLGWPEIHQSLRGGRVVWSDKEEAEGVTSIVVGRTCDGDRLRLTVWWDCGCYRMLVMSVERI